jgi:LysM repeat protein
MAEPMKKPAVGASAARAKPQRRGPERRPERSSERSPGSASRHRVHTAGGSSSRRPRDVSAGSGARILAPLALVLVALACLVVISSGGDNGPARSGSESSGSSSSGSSGAETTTKVVKKSTYTVKAGDSFSAIAESQGVDVDVLQELNPDVDPRALQPGQKLKLKE